MASGITYFMKKNRQRKVGSGSPKLDISKAHDKVEMYFLKMVMHRMGFHSDWINNLIMLRIYYVNIRWFFNQDLFGCYLPHS